MAKAWIDTKYLDEIGEEIRNFGYNQYSQNHQFTLKEKEGATQLKDVIKYIGQLNLSNSISQEKLALEDIPVRCFVTEKNSVQNQLNINISENAPKLIQGIKISNTQVLVGWIEKISNKMYIRVLMKNEENQWQLQGSKQIQFENIRCFDFCKLVNDSIILGFTTDANQGFLRLDINNGNVREHGTATIVNDVLIGENNNMPTAGFPQIKLWKSNDTEFGVILWGKNDGQYGATISYRVNVYPYDTDANGTSQPMATVPGSHICSMYQGHGYTWQSYTTNDPHSLAIRQVSNNIIFVARVALNENVVTNTIRYINGRWWEVGDESTQGSVNGSGIITTEIISNSKAIVCYTGQQAVWAKIVAIQGNTASNPQKLLDGNFSRLELYKYNTETYCLAAYGTGANSSQSKLLKFKIDISNNNFTTIYQCSQENMEEGSPVFMNNIDILTFASFYNTETQGRKVIASPLKVNLGVTVAKQNDQIIGVSSQKALQGEYCSVEVIRPEQ
jgi:hypothetical protein